MVIVCLVFGSQMGRVDRMVGMCKIGLAINILSGGSMEVRIVFVLS